MPAMRAVGAILGFVIIVAVGVFFAWPLSVLQAGFVAVGVLLEVVIVWAYFASPPAVTVDR